MHSQRLLLAYFAFAGSDITNALGRRLNLDNGAYRAACAEHIHRCFDTDEGGFRPEPVDQFLTSPTLTMTHCALFVLSKCGAVASAKLSWLDAQAIVRYIRRCLVRPAHSDVRCVGGFRSHPHSSEIDCRFTYSAVMTLHFLAIGSVRDVLGHEEAALATQFVLRCFSSHEGGFSALPGLESHGGMTYCAVGALVLLGKLEPPLRRAVRRYCMMRLVLVDGGSGTDTEPVVGFQGRPSKPADSCYSHWIGGTLAMLSDIDNSGGQCCSPTGPAPFAAILGQDTANGIGRFLWSCFDQRTSCFGKDAECCPDPLHTCFSIVGLSLAGEPSFAAVDPLRGGAKAAPTPNADQL